MTRAEIHSTFVARFSVPRMTPAAKIADSDLRAVEVSLRTTFPRSYVSFVLTHGQVFSPGVLHELVTAHEAGRRSPEGFDVREFFSPGEIIETHRMYVSGGMDDSLIPFAMDSAGSVFGFRKEQSPERPDDLPVLFFDHDFCKIHEDAKSFDEWLAGFAQLTNE